MKTSTVTIKTLPTVSASTQRDAAGAYLRTYSTTKYSNVRCRIEDASASVSYAYAQRGLMVSHRIFTQQSGIAVKDRVDTSDSRYYVVNGVEFRRAIGGMEDFYVLLCEEYRPGA